MRLRQVFRRLIQSPMFTVVTVATLAIGIGANSAIFSVIEGVLLKPLPYPGSQNLLAVNHAAPGISLKDAGAAPFLYFTYRDESRTLQDVGLMQTNTASITGLAEPEEIRCLDITHEILPVLGI